MPPSPSDTPGFGRTRKRTQLASQVLTWLSGGALALNVLMIAGLLVLLAYMGMGYFWPHRVQQYTLTNGDQVWGELHDREAIRDLAKKTTSETATRINVRVGNRELYENVDFRWIPEAEIRETTNPKDLAQLERRAGGNFYGRLIGLSIDGEEVAKTGDDLWSEFQIEIEKKRAYYAVIEDFEDGELADISEELTALRKRRNRTQRKMAGSPELSEALAKLDAERAKLDARSEELSAQLRQMYDDWSRSEATFKTAEGESHRIKVANILHALQPNDMSWLSKLGTYCARIWGFIWDEPRESNTEGGIFPAIFGTVLMVFLMTFAVTPFGVLAALYLREYAKEGLVVRIVRIAVNNLAGVPSIVFGIFGLGFFVYLIGGSIDSLFFSDTLPTPTFGTGGVLWAALTLALLTVPVVIVATEEGLAAVPKIVRQGSLALGATKFETTWKVVLPAAGPGILTGVILAIARAAGEVAPLMIVGMVKLADVPVDGNFPFLHLESKFMHLGFHIYDVGFQSPNVDATKPLVYATALLLVLLVTAMNIVAITARNHLRRKYATSAV